METLQMDMVKYWKAGMVFEKNVLANMTDAIKKASMTPKGRIAITDQLVDETLIKYQKTVQEQYDTCPETDENPERAAELKQRKALYLKELNLVKDYLSNSRKNCEKVLKKYSRYLFRYLASKFLGAEGSYKVQKSAFKRYKMLSSVLKTPKFFLHVAQDANISSAAESK